MNSPAPHLPLHMPLPRASRVEPLRHTTIHTRWEQGSDFHWLPFRPPPHARTRPEHHPWSSGLPLFSGREALRLLLDHGARTRGWRRLWVPSYYCQDVITALRERAVQLLFYPDHPLRDAPDLPSLQPGDALLIVNFFGLRSRGVGWLRDGIEVIEDHTHDPDSEWARSSAADFCIASLRKSLPIPDGAALWSPRGHRLPHLPKLTSERRQIAAARLSSMILKALYLEGRPVDKEAYRALASQAERALDTPGVSAMSDLTRAVLATYPVNAWRRARAKNHRLLSARLSGLGWAQILSPSGRGSAPFCCTLVADSATRRERVRRHLIAHRIYPAVLWPLAHPIASIDREAHRLSRRILNIHCDGRYTLADLLRVGDLLAAYE